MQEYDFTLHYLEGKKNTRADALSRREGEEEKRKDNQDVIMLPNTLFKRMTIRGIMTVVEGEREEIMRKYHDDPLAGHPGVKRMKKQMEGKVDWPGMEEDVKK